MHWPTLYPAMLTCHLYTRYVPHALMAIDQTRLQTMAKQPIALLKNKYYSTMSGRDIVWLVGNRIE